MNDIQLAISFIHDLGLAILTNLFTLESISDGVITISGVLFFVTCYRTYREYKIPSIFDDDIHKVRQSWIKKINCYFRSLSAVKVLLFVFLCALAAGCIDEARTFLAIALLVIAVVSCALFYHTHPDMMPFNPTHSHADIEWLFHLNKKFIEPHLKKSFTLKM